MAPRFLSPIDGRSQSQSGFLPNQRYLWVISALLGIGVLSPLSGTLFTFSFGYSVEVPILLTMSIGLLASFKLNVALSRAIFIGLVGGFLALLPFVVFAIINGTPFASYYPDFRAILLLIVTYVGLSALNEGTALELIYKTCVLAVLTTGVLFLLQHSGFVTGVVSHNFTGQYFPPVYPVIIAVIFMSHKKAFAFPILAILLLLLMTVTASYRQLYLISALLILSGMHVVFYGFVGRLASLAFATAFFILVIGSIVTVNIYPNHVYDVLHTQLRHLEPEMR